MNSDVTQFVVAETNRQDRETYFSSDETTSVEMRLDKMRRVIRTFPVLLMAPMQNKTVNRTWKMKRDSVLVEEVKSAVRQQRAKPTAQLVVRILGKRAFLHRRQLTHAWPDLLSRRSQLLYANTAITQSTDSASWTVYHNGSIVHSWTKLSLHSAWLVLR